MSSSREKAKKIYLENPDHPLIGVYNIETKEIFLIPCIKERVWLEEDHNGNFIRGWRLNALHKGLPKDADLLDDSEIIEYNASKHAPRFYSNVDDSSKAYSSHMYLLRSLGQSEHAEKFRGFTVTPGDVPTFAWISNSLNPEDSEMPSNMKVAVRQIVSSFQKVEPSTENKVLVTEWLKPKKGTLFNKESDFKSLSLEEKIVFYIERIEKNILGNKYDKNDLKIKKLQLNFLKGLLAESKQDDKRPLYDCLKIQKEIDNVGYRACMKHKWRLSGEKNKIRKLILEIDMSNKSPSPTRR